MKYLGICLKIYIEISGRMEGGEKRRRRGGEIDLQLNIKEVYYNFICNIEELEII